MDQKSLLEFDEAVRSAEGSIDSFLHLCSEMEDYLVEYDSDALEEAQKWAEDALDVIGSKLADRDTREVAIGLLIRELHCVGAFILRECVDEAVHERFCTEMV